MRAALSDPATHPLGKLWLLRVFDRSDLYRYRLAHTVVDDEVVARVLHAAETAAPGRDRGIALHLVHTAQSFQKITGDQAEALADNLIRWAPTLDSDEVRGYRWMLNLLRGGHPSASERVCRAVSPELLAGRISAAGERWASSGWADVIRELQPSWADGALSEWNGRFAQSMDHDALRTWLTARDESSEPFEIYEIIDTLAFTAPRAAQTAFATCADEIREAFEANLPDAVRNFGEWAFGSMLHVAMMADAPSSPIEVFEDEDRAPDEHDDERKKYLQAVTPVLMGLAAEVLTAFQQVDWAKSIRTLRGQRSYKLSNLDSALAWLAQLSTDITDRIAEALADTLVNDALTDLLRDRDPESDWLGPIIGVLETVCWGPRGRVAVRRILEGHPALFSPFPADLIRPYPDLCAQLLRKGAAVDPAAPRNNGWLRVTFDLGMIRKHDADAAALWLTRSTPRLAEAFTVAHDYELRGIAAFIAAADEIEPRALDDAVRLIDPAAARDAWTAGNHTRKVELRAILERATTVACPAGDVARTLLRELNTNP